MGPCGTLMQASGGPSRAAIYDLLANDTYGVVLATAQAGKDGQVLTGREVHVWRLAGGKATAYRGMPEPHGALGPPLARPSRPPGDTPVSKPPSPATTEPGDYTPRLNEPQLPLLAQTAPPSQPLAGAQRPLSGRQHPAPAGHPHQDPFPLRIGNSAPPA